MRKTCQMTVSDIVHTVGKPQTVFAEDSGCSQKSWLEGKSLAAGLSKKSDSPPWETFTGWEGLVSVQCQERSHDCHSPNIKPARRQSQRCLLEVESGRRMETHIIQCFWNPEWSFHSPSWCGVSNRLLVLVVVGQPVFYQVQGQHGYQKIQEHMMLPSADKLLWICFLFLEDLAPVHSTKATAQWFVDCVINVLDWFS